MKLRFAFAVSKNGDFQKNHFGNADKYIIYEHDSKKLVYIDEIKNINKDIDEETTHGSLKKGNAVIDYLKKNNIHVLVSMQFGKNIKMVDKHFIPIITDNKNMQSVFEILEKNITSIKNESAKSKDNYALFRINKGFFKQQFKQYKS